MDYCTCNSSKNKNSKFCSHCGGSLNESKFIECKICLLGTAGVF